MTMAWSGIPLIWSCLEVLSKQDVKMTNLAVDYCVLQLWIFVPTRSPAMAR